MSHNPDTLQFIVRGQIADLLSAYVQCLDDDRLEEWPDFFLPNAVYKILPRENADQGLPLALVACFNQSHMRDRIRILRSAAVYSRRFERHLVSGILVQSEHDKIYKVRSNFVVYGTDPMDGVTQILAAGQYDDDIAFVNGTFKFLQKIVTIDTFSVPDNLGNPL